MTASTTRTPCQPYNYARVKLTEPDWRRFPGWDTVTETQWRDAQWQRSHCIADIGQLRRVTGNLLSDRFFEDLAADHAEFATMSMLVPPHMLNSMAPDVGYRDFTEAFMADPIRRYVIPVRSDRDPEWPSHPHATRDSLHEAEMWVAEGLTHRYPAKVLAEVVTTCPQYCGHCTRMDLVGKPTTQVEKRKFLLRPDDRQDRMIEYLRNNKAVRDVVVSGGDVANVPWHRLEAFLMRLLEIDSIRDIRLATKALAGLPQHWLQLEVLDGLARIAAVADRRAVRIAMHTHINHVQSVTPLVAEASRAVLAAGVHDVRNQGVLMRGVNDSPAALLDLCFAAYDEAAIMPYYFYMCDMIPNSEHWRLAVWEAQELQHAIMGYLPGFATPRVVVDVSYVGKQWVHQPVEYDRKLGISYWTKNYLTPLEVDRPDAFDLRYPYYDPINTLPRSGIEWWKRSLG